jgi:hypothetical protein
MKKVKGIIMRICCFKYEKLRDKFKIDEKNIEGWEIINIYGKENLDEPYIFENNKLIIKCYDTYLHLSTKIILALKILKENYKIEEGIIKCDDDLIFNKNNLITFLKKEKEDYIGKNFDKKILTIL